MVLLIINIFILEVLLSIDNAAVLGLMVRDLPLHQRYKALRYGIFGAFAFRGLSLLFVSFLIKISWLKILGGLYLLYLVYGHFTAKKDTIEEGIDKKHNKLYINLKLWLTPFWATVILVEVMDMAFSIDNIFAAVAMSSVVYIVIIGVSLGIIAMRFVAQLFSMLIERFPSLERSAFIVIGLLGVKLILSGTLNYYNFSPLMGEIMALRWFDISFSGVMMVIFITPILLTKRV